VIRNFQNQKQLRALKTKITSVWPLFYFILMPVIWRHVPLYF